MGAGSGFKTFASGDILTASDVNGYLMQGVWVFANAAARTAAVTSPQEGNVSFLKDTNSFEIYDGAAWVAYGSGDITGVTTGANSGLTGGATSGTADIKLNMAAKGDLIAGTGSGTSTVVTVGANGRILTADSTATGGVAWKIDPVSDLVTTAGDLIYGTAADTVTRLGIGTAGQFLKVNSGATAPEWAAAPTSNANWSLVNAGGTALTGATTITVSGISSANSVLVIIKDASSANASSIFSMQLNSDTGSNYALYGGRITAPSTYAAGTVMIDVAGTGSSITMGAMGNNAADEYSGYALISGGNTAGLKMLTIAGGVTTSGSGQFAQYAAGYWNGTDTISSVSFVSSSGNFDNGTIFVYKTA